MIVLGKRVETLWKFLGEMVNEKQTLNSISPAFTPYYYMNLYKLIGYSRVWKPGKFTRKLTQVDFMEALRRNASAPRGYPSPTGPAPILTQI